ncbi:MAG: choice-of-anchor J domain-containing protein [Candidatus Delongbacteria bacterium]|nr:choice-of-anchor J domain-containing protein [Candidatus Delongbacteria bacterium]MBN2835099.1 choice-of-anchor J domain-containing protein [Candidatus Delongbacteria bacterium]
MKRGFLKTLTVLCLILFVKLSSYQESILIPHEAIGQNYDGFGRCVSIKDDMAIVGSYYDDDVVIDQGLVYIYYKNGNDWEIGQILTPDTPIEEGNYGVFTWTDGETIIIGANTDMAEGAVYIYEHNGTEWVKTQRIEASDGEQLDDFGYHVSISGDKMIISAQNDDDFNTNSGAVYYFHKENGSWVEKQKIYPHDPVQWGGFGQYHAMNDNTLFVSYYLKDNGAGRVDIYNLNGDTWEFESSIFPDDSQADSWFGRYILLDNNSLFISASLDDGNGLNSGSVYVFNFDGSEWVQSQKLVPNDITEGANLGEGIAISGNKLAIGALFDDEVAYSAGAVFMYDFNGSEWVYDRKVVGSTLNDNDYFGESVALDGNQMIVGAYFKEFTGQCFIYSLVDTQAPEVVSLNGNVADICNDMQITISVSEDTGVESVVGKVEINGVIQDILFTNVTKSEAKRSNGKSLFTFTGIIPAQNEPVQGTIYFELTDTMNPPYSGVSETYDIEWTYPQIALVDESFEGSTFPPDGWVIIDNDGDTYNWEESNWNPLSGAKHAKSHSYNSTSQALTPDNWLILPPIENPETLSYWVCSLDISWASEKYGVYVSLTDANPSSFQEVFTEVMTAKQPGDWYNREIDLSEYDGTVYVAFRHWDCTDMWALALDDVKVFRSEVSTEDEIAPSSLVLLQNYPNPFNPVATLRFITNESNIAEIVVFNSTGEIVENLTKNTVNGINVIDFDGSKFASGVYYYQVKIGNNFQKSKMMLIK